MLSLKDCVDYCGLSDDAVSAIQYGAGVNALEACVLAQDAEQSARSSRRMLQYLQTYLEHVESQENPQRSHEVHQIIDHFVTNHRLI